MMSTSRWVMVVDTKPPKRDMCGAPSATYRHPFTTIKTQGGIRITGTITTSLSLLSPRLCVGMEEVQVAFVSTLVTGHLVPMVELARRIVGLRRRLSITIITIPLLGSPPDLAALVANTSIPNLTFLQLPPIDPPPSALPSFQAIATAFIDLYNPAIKSALSATPFAALVVNFFCSSAIEIGLQLDVPTYAFFPIGAAQLGLLFYSDTIDASIPADGISTETDTTTVPFPGFSSTLPLSALPDALVHGKDEVYYWFQKHYHRLKKSKGVVMNTFAGLETKVIGALEKGLYFNDGDQTPPVYPVGPLVTVQEEQPGEEGNHECLRWLDGHPRGSVVYLCFGSMGRFSAGQVEEIARGLERSGERFLWVVWDDGVPEGFKERTGDRGLVWRCYAPQAAILRHPAVGGFVTHCGWNSFLEGLWFGVPMLAWPRYAEQHFNAYAMVEEMGVAMEVRTNRAAGNSATAEEVERAVKSLMGEESSTVREKVKLVREKARSASEVGGSSYRTLDRVVQEWIAGRGSEV